MSEEPKKSRPWVEEVSFADCPYCGECEDLGSGSSFKEGTKVECSHCLSVFIITREEIE